MTREEAIKMLTAKVECMTRDTSGMDEECNSHNCGGCHLCYEQGNMGEQIEYLHMAIKALEEPQWIPWNSGKFPEESATYTVTAYDGATRRVTYAKYQKQLKRWELTGARAYWRVLAWRPLPEPWRGDEE